MRTTKPFYRAPNGALAIPQQPLDDRRTRPVYHASRGMTALASGGRKRQIAAPS